MWYLTINKLNQPLLCLWLLTSTSIFAAATLQPREIIYAETPAAPARQSTDQVALKSNGCLTCHTTTDRLNMHNNEAIHIGCTDCHGGDANTMRASTVSKGTAEYQLLVDSAHVQPRYPTAWHYPSSANPQRSYTLLNKESPEFIRFINPSDYRVAHKACGACHADTIEAAKRSLMTTSAMLWGGAAYNNGILPYKRYILGESYDAQGVTASIRSPGELTERDKARGVLPQIFPLPAWEVIPPGDIFRVFERGGRNIGNLFPETAIPNIAAQIQRLEEPGRVDFRQSNRGPGTGGRIAVPVINLTKTRLNDPHMYFMGTNDQPGDYRNSGCAGCHTIYANDRDVRHSGPYAQYGHEGMSQSLDPTIPKNESGHPIRHAFTRAIPSSQCMSCHMHQPNMFVNTYLGYTMWDYESDAPAMWPTQQVYPTDEQRHAVLARNPEGAAPRGKWADIDFLKKVSELNPTLTDTQFADYHGHGWNFRAVFKRDRAGNLLDQDNNIVADDDPAKFNKAVHLSSIHLDKGMHCVDCHFSIDNHGTGNLHGEVAAAVEIQCQDCHGSVAKYPILKTTGPAAPSTGTDLSLLRNPDGKLRFEWINNKLVQRSLVTPGLEWEVSLVKDSINPAHPNYNLKAARAKTMSDNTQSQAWGMQVRAENYAHKDEQMECYTCHTSWTTSCGGCHLPIEANNKTDRYHFEGGSSRNYATYNPQVARDAMFQLGRRGPLKGNRIAPVRSSSALVLSSTNANRERIYIQQPPISASGYSSQAFAPHFPHTVRKTETKTCTDCHLSAANDNNAIMAQLLLQGTNFVNFVGLNAWLGTQNSIAAVQVTEWDEPQAVLGSYLHRYAYPDFYQQHLDRDRQLQHAHSHRSHAANCVTLRGEYLFVAEGKQGMQVYDVASIANKGISQRIISAPFSPLGHNTRIKSKQASCVALPTNQPIQPSRNQGKLMRETNLEQPFHPIYHYALITDRQEGLILTDIDTLMDGEPRNNFLKRSLTWNENQVLDGARHITIGGSLVYITADIGIVILNLDDPLAPNLVSIIPIRKAHASALQLRYLMVTSEQGFHVVDITRHASPSVIENAFIPLEDAHKLYLARTYAYVAAGKQGVAIIDIENPEQPKLVQLFTAQGKLNDARDIIVATTNASLYAYVADGKNGLKVLHLTAPDRQPGFYGFSPAPKPILIAHFPTDSPALALAKGLDRDRAVDEMGGQIAVFGRLGARPLNVKEMQKLYLDSNGYPWFVTDDVQRQENKDNYFKDNK